jgi:hypothetical protein
MDESEDDRRASGQVGRPVAPEEESGASAVPEAEVFRFDQVDRAGGRIHSPGARKGLSLDFDARGIEVFGPRAGRRQTIPWSDVAWIAFDAPVVAPDGHTESPIDVESTAGLVRYVVKSEGSLAVAMAALEIQVARWTSAQPDALVRGNAPGGEVAPPPPGWTLLTPPPPPPASPPPRQPPPGTLPYPSAGTPSGYGPALPYAFDTTAPAPNHPFDTTAPFGGMDPVGVPSLPGTTKKRTRRTVVLVVAIALVVGGVGLGVGLSATDTTAPPTKVAITPAPSADQHLAEQLLLARNDLPVGWRASTNPGTNANSPALRQGEARITTELARCMGVTDAEGAVILGGQAADQTAQISSPIFVAPAPATAGTAVELQTAATVVRSHKDEQQDLALFSNPKYPQCAATASAEELQLGVNQTSGGGDQAGPATATTVDLPGAAGVQLSGVLMNFTVVDGTATVHVQVESITLGAHRVEAGLEVFALGGQIPTQSLAAAIATFEQRVASGGASSVV